MTTTSAPPASKPTGKYAAYDKVVLQVGSKGSAVKVLQAALRISPADGDFGPQTRAKVVAYQKAKHLSATGVVTSLVWRALSADADRPTGRYAAYDKVVLQVGSKGSAVKVLQAALRIVPADGAFGPQTKAKVVAYQKAKQLSATGIVTSPVWRALSADAQRKPAPRPAPKPAQAARKPAPKVTGKYAAYDKVVLQVGSTGSAVKVLQSALRIVPADGAFGPQTKAKVVAYQKAKQLSATGIVTSPVWRALSADADRPTGKYAAYDKVVLKVGSKGSAVTVLQKALRIAPADGAFGPQTKAKVVAYQKARKLSATGIVTSPVWRALSVDAARAASSVSRSTVRCRVWRPSVVAAKVPGRYAAYDKVVLKVGSKGSAVKVLQSALRIKPVDGDFGPQTRAAVVRYQKARRLSATGVVTSAVWRALSADARAQAEARAQAGAQAGTEARAQAGPEARARPVTGKYAAYDKVVLKVGSKGAAVTVLQSALWVTPADGEFGPQTKAAVVAYQQAGSSPAQRRRDLDGVARAQRRRGLARPRSRRPRSP